MRKITSAQLEHMLGMNAWVRPVCTQMRAVAIPEPIVQKTMFYLLSELDAAIGGRATDQGIEDDLRDQLANGDC